MTNTHERSTTIRVLIVDDHPLFRDGLESALRLEDDIEVVGQCSDGEQAITTAVRLRPDVVLLDINLPSMNGLQVARQIRAERSAVAVIMLTAYHDNEQVLHAMRSGAAAYCPKDVDSEKLLEVIRNVANGYFVVNERLMREAEVQDWIADSVERMAGPYTVDSQEHFIPLSPREVEILQFVTNGLSNKEIAVRLGISQQTVKNHMTSILKKLNVQDRTQAAVTALRHGWVRINN